MQCGLLLPGSQHQNRDMPVWLHRRFSAVVLDGLLGLEDPGLVLHAGLVLLGVRDLGLLLRDMRLLNGRLEEVGEANGPQLEEGHVGERVLHEVFLEPLVHLLAGDHAVME